MKFYNSLTIRTLALALTATSGSAWAGDGIITGHVNAVSESILNGVQVTISDMGRTTSTDRYGNFSFTNVPEGDHTVVFSYLGFKEVERTAKVTANETVQIDEKFFENMYMLDPIEVVATIGSEARALNQQRTAPTLTNIVSADAVGHFPDQNAAEALSRVPGISVDRDMGEGRYVVIRGVDSNLNTCSVDGVELAAPKDNERSVLMDIIPSGVMESIQVFKVTTPDMPADGIGGHVNIVTPSAFEANTLVMRLLAQGNYSDLSDKWGERVEATYGDVFGTKKQWGLMVSASYDKREMAANNQESDDWKLNDDGAWVSDKLEYRDYTLNRTRTGANFNLEYKPSDTSLFYLRGNYNHYIDHEYRDRLTFDFGDATESTASDDIISWTASSKGKIKVKSDLKDRTERLSLTGLSAGGEQKLDNLTLDYKVAWSYAEENTPSDVQTSYKLSTKNASYYYDSSRTYNPSVSYVAGDDYRDASNYKFSSTTKSNQMVEETDISGQLNVRYDLETDNQAFVKFGTLARLKKKSDDSESWEYEDIPEYSKLTDMSVNDKYYPFGTDLPFLSNAYSGYFNRNKDTYGTIYQNLGDSVAGDFDSDENVYAGYAMGSMDFGQQNVQAGLRVEYTHFNTSGWNVGSKLADVQDALASGDISTWSATDFATRMKATKNYTNFLPGVLYRYNVGKNLILRASWTNTLSRPIFTQSAAASMTDDNEIDRGNPDLDPYESMNFDTSAEYYMPHLGMISVSLFRKNIKNFIYSQTFDETIGGEDYEVTTYNNGDDAHITGLELTYQQIFTMLPDPVDGLGFMANAMISKSGASYSANGESSRDIELPRQSNFVGNMALTYQKYGIFLRAAVTYRSKYLDELGEESYQDRFVDSHVSLDISASYEVAHGWTIFANAINVTNEPLRAFFRESGKLSQYEEYGVAYQLGAKWSL